MIATIRGEITEKLGGLVVVEAGGVGYGFYATPEDHGQLKTGEETQVYIHEHIRENTYELYGFTQLKTKELFEQLLEVNGVGPKMALAILSVGSGDAVRSSIAGGDTRFLQAAPGVGKRVAERIIVDLKDKIGLAATRDIDSIIKSNALSQDEAVQALITLGFRPNDALDALKDVDTGLSTEERVKQALKGAA